MFIGLESFVALDKHRIGNTGTFGDTAGFGGIPSRPRMQTHGHRPAEVGIPGQDAPCIAHTMVSPEAVKVTAVTAPAEA